MCLRSFFNLKYILAVKIIESLPETEDLSGCKDTRNRKFEFVVKTQFLFIKLCKLNLEIQGKNQRSVKLPERVDREGF